MYKSTSRIRRNVKRKFDKIKDKLNGDLSDSTHDVGMLQDNEHVLHYGKFTYNSSVSDLDSCGDSDNLSMASYDTRYLYRRTNEWLMCWLATKGSDMRKIVSWTAFFAMIALPFAATILYQNVLIWNIFRDSSNYSTRTDILSSCESVIDEHFLRNLNEDGVMDKLSMKFKETGNKVQRVNASI